MRNLVSFLFSSFAIVAVLPGPPADAATITVTTHFDTDSHDGFCSLREAILAANSNAAYNDCPAGSGADRIVFDLPSPAAIAVVSGLPPVTETVAIRGPGADQLAVDGGNLYRLFAFDSASGGEWFLLEDLTVQHGYADDALGDGGGGVYVGPGDTVVLSRVVVAENTAANYGGGVALNGIFGVPAVAEVDQSIIFGNLALGPGGGGGVAVIDSNATVSASSLVDNRTEAAHGNGGGMAVQRGFVVLERSTVSGNSASADGGGVRIASSSGDAALSVIDSTIFDNTADGDADLDGDGGGIGTLGNPSYLLTVDLANSIVAGNHDDSATLYPDIEAGANVTLTSSGFNLIGANDGAAASLPVGNPNANFDFVGTVASPIDPMLLPLNLNQGITPSHRPVLDPGSPIIDHGFCPDSAADQRGSGSPALHQRAYDHPAVPNLKPSDGCDIGSVERGAAPNSAAELFSDGFELGHPLRWSAGAP